MKKRIAITLLAALLLAIAGAAQAGGRGHHGGHYRGGAHPGHVRHPVYGSHRARHYGRRHHGYGYHHHRDHRALKIVAGAAILGSLIATIDRPRPAVVVVPGRSWAAPAPYRGGRWYQRDSYGDCFEVRLQRDGRQVWTLVDPYRCR